jgi:hypothetical protein
MDGYGTDRESMSRSYVGGPGSWLQALMNMQCKTVQSYRAVLQSSPTEQSYRAIVHGVVQCSHLGQSCRAVLQRSLVGQLCNAVRQVSLAGESGRADLQRRQAEYRGGVVKQGSQMGQSDMIIASK